jgi:hypothetical protein
LAADDVFFKKWYSIGILSIEIIKRNMDRYDL